MEAITASFAFSQGANLSDLLKKVEAYNKKATKYGEFNLWVFDSGSNMLSGHFNPKPENGVGFLKGAKHAFQNGDLQEEFKKICALAEFLGSIRG